MRLFGAFVLAMAIPVIRPIILQIGSPELLAICVLGLSLVAVLSGGSPLKGLAAAGLGVLVATTGDDPNTSTLRWTFGTLYLFDGFPVVPIALGLFAIPEIADMAIARKSIAGDLHIGSRWSQWEGVKDVFRHKWLMLRCSVIGAGLGAVPGIGASIIDWIAYGHAARSEKGADKTFGTGDVRGVIASESSNNAKEGGALLPTIAFGVPGSASMALILGALLIHGLIPGPDMLSKNLDITYTLVWSVAIANILGAGTCFFFANRLAKIAIVRIGILAPLVLAITFIGAYQGSNAWGDIVALLIFGLIGWVMKRMHWPRPPLILGFVLGGLVERYMFISINRYGFEWLWIFRDGNFAPWVVILFAITLYGVLGPVFRSRRLRKKEGQIRESSFAYQSQNLNPNMFFTLLVLALFITVIAVSSQWEFGAKLVPQVVSWFGIGFTGWLVVSGLFITTRVRTALAEGGDMVGGSRETQLSSAGDAFKTGENETHFDIQADYGDLSSTEIHRRAGVYFAWLIFFFVSSLVIGLLPAMFLFLAGYLRFEGKESWKMTLSISVPMWIASYALFHKLLVVRWPPTLVGNLFPDLRSSLWFNLF